MFSSTVLISQDFSMPVEKVWEDISNHENFGKILKQKITILKTADNPQEPCGKGSIRKIHLPLFALEETILKSEKHKSIEYQITKNNPFAYHYGTLIFSILPNQNSNLSYQIELKSKIPFFAKLAGNALQKALSKGLKKYADKLPN